MAKQQITSAYANKMVKRLMDEKKYLLSTQHKLQTYIETAGYEPVIPDYDYVEYSGEIDEIDDKIRTLKHAINVLNTTTVVPDVGLTIDEVLVKMAQLNLKKEILDDMRDKTDRKRIYDMGRGSNLVEYECLNYDLDDVRADYDDVLREISKIQIALDIVNQTYTFDVEI